MMRTKRGVSPVIATVLLILVAVAATVIIWTWVSGAASNNPTTQPALQEKITIDGVKYDSTAQKATIYVTNLGQYDVNIASGYIIDATTSEVVCANTTSISPNNLPVTIKPQSTGEIIIGNCGLTTGKPYVAKVITTNGVTSTYNFNG